MADAKSIVYNTFWANPSYFKLNDLSLIIAVNDAEGFNFFASNKGFTNKKDIINTALLNATTANITSQPIEEWIGGAWVYTNGRPELLQLELTFRDNENMEIYRSFTRLYKLLRNKFPDEIKWSIHLLSTTTEVNNQGKETKDKQYYTSVCEQRNAILTSISQVSYAKDNPDSFATFTVTFKYANI